MKTSSNPIIWDEWKTEIKKNRFKSIFWDEWRIKIGEILKVIYHIWNEIRIEANKT